MALGKAETGVLKTGGDKTFIASVIGLHLARIIVLTVTSVGKGLLPMPVLICSLGGGA